VNDISLAQLTLIGVYVFAAIGFIMIAIMRSGQPAEDFVEAEDPFQPPPLPPQPRAEVYETPADLGRPGETLVETVLRKIPRLGSMDLAGIAFIWVIYSMGVLTPLLSQAASSGTVQRAEPTPMTILGGSFILAMIALVPLALISLRGSLRVFLGLHFTGLKKAMIVGPIVVLAMFVVLALLQLVGYDQLMKNLFGELDKQEPVKMVLEASDPALIFSLGIAAVVMAPLIEEIVFRGYLYPAMRHFTGKHFAAIFSAIIFGAIHGNVMALLPLCLLGWVMAVAFEKSRSLWVPIAIHAIFNGTQFGLMLLLKAYPDLIPATS